MADRGRPRGGVVEPASIGGSAVGGARLAIWGDVRIVKAHVEDAARAQENAMRHVIGRGGATIVGLRAHDRTVTQKGLRGRRGDPIGARNGGFAEPTQSGHDI